MSILKHIYIYTHTVFNILKSVLEREPRSFVGSFTPVLHITGIKLI